MRTIGIVEPTTLLGTELREQLERRRELWRELRLLGTRPAEEAVLTEVRGEAALVVRYAPGALDGVDLLFVCGAIADSRPILRELPAETLAIVLSPDAGPEDGRPVVAGINQGRAEPGSALLSPHPAVIALAHVLRALSPFGIEEAVATFVQPASMREEAGMDELLDQTRSILNFRAERNWQIFGRQLAFNLLPAGPSQARQLVALLRDVLGEPLQVGLQVVQGAVFHGMALSLYAACREDPGEEGVRRALAAATHLEMAAEPQGLGPIEAAARDEILIGAVAADPYRDGAYWLWGVMDNLTRGGATNALEVAEAALEGVPSG